MRQKFVTGPRVHILTSKVCKRVWKLEIRLETNESRLYKSNYSRSRNRLHGCTSGRSVCTDGILTHSQNRGKMAKVARSRIVSIWCRQTRTSWLQRPLGDYNRAL